MAKNTAPAADAPKFRRVRRVTLPTLKLGQGVERFIFALSPMYLGEKAKGSNKAAPVLMHAIDMETGEEGNIVCPTVLQSELLRNYGPEGFCRKGFSVVQIKNARGYNNVNIDEVAPPDDFTPPAGPYAHEGKVIVSEVRAKDEKTD